MGNLLTKKKKNKARPRPDELSTKDAMIHREENPKAPLRGEKQAEHMEMKRKEKGVHSQAYDAKEGMSTAGYSLRDSKYAPNKEKYIAGVKEHHKEKLEELKSMPKPKLLAKGGRVHKGFEEANGPTGPTGYRNRNKSSDFSGGQRKGPEGYPKYQEQAQNQKGVHTPVSGVTGFPGGKGTSRAGSYTKERYAGKPLFSGKDHPAIEEHKKVLKELKSMKSPKLYAEGGMCGDECGYPCDTHGEDMVSKVLGERMSKGGMIANDEEVHADEMPNEFDDLVLRDDLELSYDGANSGDELGDTDEDKKHNQMVAMAMMKRRKQHNPRPA